MVQINTKKHIVLAGILFFFILLCSKMICANNSDFDNDLNNLYRLPINSGLKKLIGTLEKNKLKHTNIGIIIQSMQSGKILFQRHANFFYTPASVQKLFTATAGIAYLTPRYRFHTRLLLDGDIRNGVLFGNLIIKFSGDPELKFNDLAELFHKLQQKGVTQITGNVYIDKTDYDNIPYPPGWIWDDLSYAYAAPLSAIIINRNKFLLHFIPKQTGHKPQLKADLPKHVAHFTNDLITIKQHVKYCPITIYSNNLGYYLLKGCLDKRWGEQRRTLAIRNMNAYSKLVIKKLLTNNHITFSKSIQFHRTPRTATLLIDHASPPLTNVIKEMLKDSDNLTTNSVLKKTGENYFGTQGNWQNGIRALKKILTDKTDIDFKNTRIVDGAGLSRYNLITPHQIAKLLYYIYHSKLRKPLVAALPIAGKDGTLQDRMPDEGREQRIHAKTGSMTGISSLAGYVYSKHNGVISFVIMVNSLVSKRAPYIKIEDKICRFLVNAKRGAHG